MKKYLLCLLSVIMLLCMLLSFPALAESVHLTLDTQSGFFTEPFTLTVTCDHPDARVFYTLDGSIPDENSLPFPADGLFMDRTGKMEDTPLTTTVVSEVMRFIHSPLWTLVTAV